MEYTTKPQFYSTYTTNNPVWETSFTTNTAPEFYTVTTTGETTTNLKYN